MKRCQAHSTISMKIECMHLDDFPGVSPMQYKPLHLQTIQFEPAAVSPVTYLTLAIDPLSSDTF